MAGWPLLLLTIGGWFHKDSLNETTGGIDLDSFYYSVWLPALIWLFMAGWIIITYLCIGKKNVVALILVCVAIYVSPLPMYAASDWECGPIPEWKCRWTCKSVEELKELGIGHDYWAGNPDVIKAGGLCN